MNPKLGRARACPEVPVTPVILNGGAWTARRVLNNCLRQHCHALATMFRRAEYAALKSRCARLFPILETRSRVLTGLHPNDLAVVAAVARLGAYAGRWVRAPEDWFPAAQLDPREQWADLLRHLFALFPVPVAFDKAWEVRGPLEHLERDCWCALAQGRSLRSVEGLPPSIPHRVLHEALTREADSRPQTFAAAIWSAQLKAFRASPGLVATVLSSRAGRELNHHALWARLAAKFASGAEADAAQFALVADTLVAIREHRSVAQLEALLRLPLESLIRHCIRFVIGLLEGKEFGLKAGQLLGPGTRTVLARYGAKRWKPRFGDEPFVSQKHRHSPRPWRVEELCSVEAVNAEGNVMSHCVGSYANGCRLGWTAIFSVRRVAVRADLPEIVSYATIEVHPRTRKVLQIRAYRNRPVNNTVLSVVHEWATARGLQCSF